jgi:hypothetical protein
MSEDEDGQGGSDKRRHQRHSVLFSGLLHQGDRTFECIIKDISATGAQVLTNAPVPESQDLVLDIDRAGAFTTRLVWRRENRAGMEFLHDPASVARRIGTAWGLSD